MKTSTNKDNPTLRRRETFKAVFIDDYLRFIKGDEIEVEIDKSDLGYMVYSSHRDTNSFFLNANEEFINTILEIKE